MAFLERLGALLSPRGALGLHGLCLHEVGSGLPGHRPVRVALPVIIYEEVIGIIIAHLKSSAVVYPRIMSTDLDDLTCKI
jgi:hypothetical protein